MAARSIRITKQIVLPHAGSSNKGSIQLFPWPTARTGETVFNGKWRSDAQWSAMVVEFSRALAVVDGKCLYVLHADGLFSFCFPLNADVSQDKDTPQVAWALRSSHPFDPLVIVADHRRVFVFNVRQKNMVGYNRGHGGRITSIAVHPTSPNVFATTSSDFTTRIYNLDNKAVSEIPENPTWSPWSGPSGGSAAHGTDGSDSTGSGLSRCFQLLVGGRSGGNSWDVLGAAFHPHLPLLATCGADRHVKIWRVVSEKGETVFRDDKPLFSARITTSRVLSIAWLGKDVLLIHTAVTSTPKELKRDEEDEDGPQETPEPEKLEIENEPGSLTIFQWLGLKRFFPTSSSIPDPAVRGGASDYQESKSYTLISTEALHSMQDLPPDMPPEAIVEPISNISQPQFIPGCFLLVYPDSTAVRMWHASKSLPRTISPNEPGDGLDTVTQRFHKKLRLEGASSPSPTVSARGIPSADQLFESDDFLDSGVSHIEACALTHAGDVVILGSKGRIWFLSEG
ncbi:WD40-repeat-containing domain protein [Mycena galopus ATCC 62051]|nr:WD40-repeat-containing domain protein [Mycena galopus ATCC 62051]